MNGSRIRTEPRDRSPSLEFKPRQTCFQCFRPAAACYCHLIPTINNKTDVVILQHSHERDHPFNSARMVKLALKRCRLIHGDVKRLSKIEFDLSARSGVLYPSPDARDLMDLDVSERPEQLFVIDGTWAQAKTLVRDLPQLNSMPRYSLTPPRPGQFQIRREPNDISLSTVEATVASLRAIEPDTVGFEELLEAFQQMNVQQLRHPNAAGHYCGPPKTGQTLNVPGSILDGRNIVVAYGEAAYRDSTESNQKWNDRLPVVWVAARIGMRDDGQEDSELFATTIQTENELTTTFLRHLEMPRSSFEEARSLEEFRTAWQGFLRDDDLLVVYNHGCLQLLKNLDLPERKSVALKSVRFRANNNQQLDEFLALNDIAPSKLLPMFGRAGRRLSNSVALLKYLRRVKSVS